MKLIRIVLLTQTGTDSVTSTEIQMLTLSKTGCKLLIETQTQMSSSHGSSRSHRSMV